MTKPLEPGTIFRGIGMEWKWVVEEGGTCRRLSGSEQGTRIGSESSEILGRLPPDQLDATEWRDEWRLPENYDPEEHDLWWHGGHWFARRSGEWEEYGHYILVQSARSTNSQSAKTPLTPGLVVAFRSWPEREEWSERKRYRKVKLGDPLVVIDPKDFKTNPEEGEAEVRWLPEHGRFRLTQSPVRETDDLEILGRLPLDQLYTATEIPQKARDAPTGDAGTTDSGDVELTSRASSFPVGTRFRFREWPQRFGPVYDNLDTEWQVTSHTKFTGEGQAFGYGPGGCWRYNKGVLTTDAIEMIQPVDWVGIDEPDEPLPVGTRFRFRSWPERWDSEPCATLTEWWYVSEKELEGGAKGQAFGSQKGHRFAPKRGVLPTDDIEILELPAPEVEKEGQPEPKYVCTIGDWKIVENITGAYRWAALKAGITEKSNDLPALIGRLQPSDPGKTGATSLPPFTWRGWEIQECIEGNWHWKGTKVHENGYKSAAASTKEEGVGPLLDRIAEAEGLEDWQTVKTSATIERDKAEEQLATERAAREKAVSDREESRKAADAHSKERDKIQLRHFETIKAFHAATGHDYEPGRDYNIDASWSDRQHAIEDQYKRQKKLSQEYSMHVKQKDPPMPTLKPGDRFRFLTFPRDYGYRPTLLQSTFIMGPNNLASYEKEIGDDPEYCWQVKGCTYELIEEDGKGSCLEALVDGITFEATPQKESRMLKFLKFSPKFVGKYGLLFLAFSALSNPADLYNGAKEWWTAPTALELGDWVKISACTSCNHVLPTTGEGNANALCPSCGGEEFSTRKAQSLWDYTPPRSWNWQSETPVGYVFEDGSATVAPGTWKLPERVVTKEL